MSHKWDFFMSIPVKKNFFFKYLDWFDNKLLVYLNGCETMI